jgi:phosphoserine phosphatase RsbX
MNAAVIEWGVACQAYPGEPLSGDRHVVVQNGNVAKVAVIDGIGHGSEAAQAAEAAVDVIESYSEESVERLFSRCHERLSMTRGAAITLVCFDRAENSLTWLGAGNVMAVLVRDQGASAPHRTDLMIRSGVVGSQLPALTPLRTELQYGDLLVMTTDGIGASFIDSVRSRENLQRQADRILDDYQVANDDALVLLARYGNLADSGSGG